MFVAAACDAHRTRAAAGSTDAVIVDVSAVVYVLVLSQALDSQSKTIVTMVLLPAAAGLAAAPVSLPFRLPSVRCFGSSFAASNLGIPQPIYLNQPRC